MSRAFRVLALALAATLTPSVTHADGVASPEPPAQPEPPTTPGSRSHDTLRLALLGDYRGVADLSAFGGGLALSVGRADDRHAGQLELRGIAGRTYGGLTTLELGVGASGEIRMGNGAFLGAGGGLALFGVQRATDGSEMLSLGPEVFGRAGYRFGKYDAPFVALDLGVQLHAGGDNAIATWVWGPTLEVGYAF